MNEIIQLIKDGISEMKQTDKKIRYQQYIRSQTCNKNWTEPEEAIVLGISNGKIYIADHNNSSPKMEIIQGWVTRINGIIHSVTCIGQLFDGSCRQYKLTI